MSHRGPPRSRWPDLALVRSGAYDPVRMGELAPGRDSHAVVIVVMLPGSSNCLVCQHGADRGDTLFQDQAARGAAVLLYLVWYTHAH